MIIRGFQKGDLPQLRNSVQELHEEVRRYDPALPPAEAIIETYFGYLLQKAAESRGAFFIAEKNGEFAGHACLFGQVRSEEADEEGRIYAFLAELYVRPAFRKLKIGQKLLERAENHAREIGSGSIELKVYAGNRESVQFYHANGWRMLVHHMGKLLR